MAAEPLNFICCGRRLERDYCSVTDLVILLQNVSLKAQLLEFCSKIRNSDFHVKEKLTRAVTKATWQ